MQSCHVMQDMRGDDRGQRGSFYNLQNLLLKVRKEQMLHIQAQMPCPFSVFKKANGTDLWHSDKCYQATSEATIQQLPRTA